MEKNEIFRIYGKNYKEMTKEILGAADLASLIPSSDSRIAIKPNLVSPSPADWGATSHPELAAGIIEYLREHGFTDLRIIEGSWVGDSTQEAFEVCGFRKLEKKYGVPLFDSQKDTSSLVDCGGMALKICDCLQDVDFLINVPVLKGHCQTKLTCALKNMKGLLPNSEKRHFHSMGLHKPIAHLALGIRQDFILVDHICGDLDFEDGGNPVVRNCIMAARDPVLVDSLACSMLHISPEEVPYLTIASQLGCGSLDLEKAVIRTLGENQEEDLPRERKIVELQDAVEEVESCSACYACLLPALDRLKEEGLLKYLPEKISIGQGWKKKTGSIGVGNCTAGFDFSIRGCPPAESQIYRELKEYIKEGKR